MKKIIFLLAITLTAINTKAQDTIKWLSFEDAIALNKKTPKPLIIAVYTDWCGYCKKMDLKTYSKKNIIKAINNNFYAVKLNGEGKKDIVYKGHTFKYQKNGNSSFHELPATLMNGRLGYPTTIFLTEKEAKIESVSGYYDHEKFEKILNYFSSKKYETKKWGDFRQSLYSKR